jgi:ferrous iron transport protein A
MATFMQLLNHLVPGQGGRIVAIHVAEDFRRRLVALGLKPGNHIEVVRKGLFTGPLQVRVGTTDIIIRRCDARHIEIAV